MATTQIYTCDICKGSKSKDDLSQIIVRTEGIIIKDMPYGGIKIDICQDCLKKKGFVVMTNTSEETKQAQAQNRVTLEDKIFDILNDLGVAFVE